MSQPVYDLYDVGEDLPYKILSIQGYWTGETGSRYADCTIDLDGKPGYWCARLEDLTAERVAA